MAENLVIDRLCDGACAICGTVDPGRQFFDIDHDHVTGEVRGLLCYACNRGIGFLRDDAVVVASALEYLSPETGVSLGREFGDRGSRLLIA